MAFKLQVLHASDLEGGLDAIENAPNFAAIVDALEADAATGGFASVLLSSGDNYIPGPFFNAGGDFGLADTYEGFYNQLFGLIDVSGLDAAADLNGDGFFDNDEIEAQITAGAVTFDAVYTTDVNGDGQKDYFEEIDTESGRLDIAIMNALGFDASALGNHEFDAGTDILENIINYDSEEGNALSTGRYGNVNYLQEVDTPGVQFPYLSANLDFSMDFDVGALFTDAILGNESFASDLLSARENPADPAATASDSNDAKVAPATVLTRDGEQIGVVGATTQLVSQISSTGTIQDQTSPNVADMAALAALLQPIIDDVLDGADNVAGTGDDVNKVIIVSHLQQFALEQELAGLLRGVDIILAGGSDTISADDQDRLRAGDTAEQPYPAIVNDLDGNPTAIVSTDGEYSYVGRLVVEFDDSGVIDPASIDAAVSGAYATDDAGVLAVTGAATLDAAIAASDKAATVAGLTGEVTAVVTALDGDIAGEASVYLNGDRDSVRTEETNFGNLTADANLVAAQAVDSAVVVSIKNGGGIRAGIGQVIDNGDGTVTSLPTAASDLSGKEAGEISELDIDNALRFDNQLTIVELSTADLLAVLEHGVAATEAGATPGQFPQVGGLRFSFDPDQPAGSRVQSVALIDENGVQTELLVNNGMVVAGAPDVIKVVTLNFLADGGDGYPFAALAENRVDTGLGEQAALSDYLSANFPKDGTAAFDIADTSAAADTRIQNLSLRADTIGAPEATEDLAVTVYAEFVGEGGEAASEVVAHENGELFVTNGELGRIDVFDIPAPDATVNPDAVRSIDLTGLDGYDGVQSVAVKNGVVAAAIARGSMTSEVFGTEVELSQPGFVAFFDAATGALLSRVDVGNLPDQMTFSDDGTTLLVAGEGEKNADSDHDNDPLGTVAIIDVTDATVPVVNLIDFTALNGLEDAARAAGIRIAPGASLAADLEPEYTAISPDGTTAFVSLQENNAIAKIDLATQTVSDIFSLGTVDFSSESALDADDNGLIDIRNFDNLAGLRMADAIASFEVGGKTYVATANEGDSRDFDTDRVEDLYEDGLLDPSIDITGLERLEVSTVDGDIDGDGDIDVLHTLSSRSFSIYDADGTLVFDSGAQFEQIIANIAPDRFNDDDGGNSENRSDAKGPEPEAIAVGEVGGSTYAFVGLERDSGIMVYDVTYPAAAEFVTYIAPAFVDSTPEGEVARHGPEVISFIAPEASQSGKAQIAVSYEISGTTVVYDLEALTPRLTIPEIQGAGHVSAFDGQEVRTSGIVTAVSSTGYYLQDALGDGDDATSDGIFVYTGFGNTGAIAVGDEVALRGTVSEYIPGGAATGNLSTTQLSPSEPATILSSGNALPAATVLGAAGRQAPDDIVISEDELPVNLQEEPGTFDPAQDGIDFYESLEGMRVTVDAPVAISATNRFDETWVLPDAGAGFDLNGRGGLNINADADGYGDLNPERIQLQYSNLLPDAFTAPALVLGDQLSDVTGVVDYAFGNFEIRVTDSFAVETASPLTAETTTVRNGVNDLTVATYNVLNVTSAPADGDAAQIAALGAQIAVNLGAPDILSLQEIQDNSGVADDGTLSADETLQAIVDAVIAAGGPAYSFASAVVDVDGENGGVPGGNIRNAFLYRSDRVDLKETVTLESDVLADMGVTDPDAFDGTRDPLLGVFEFNGQEITLINNHLSSRFGSTPIFGGPQPFVQAGEDLREAQTKALNEVVDALLATDPDARIAVMGDLNTFEFTDELTEDLPGTGSEKVLTNLIGLVDQDDAYSYVFDGNAQALDHIFVSDELLDMAQVDYVHVNNDFPSFVSDHEPIVARFVIKPNGLDLTGTTGRDVLQGMSGDDQLAGKGGRDKLIGYMGDDELFGGAGRDRLIGGKDDDLLVGGKGRDVLKGGQGDDKMWGGQGLDTFIFKGEFGSDRLLDFDVEKDLILFVDASASDVTLRENALGTRVVVDGGQTEGKLFLVGQFDLHADDFIFV